MNVRLTLLALLLATGLQAQHSGFSLCTATAESFEEIVCFPGSAHFNKSLTLTQSITEYFINPDNIGEIEFIFVFEAPRRIIGYKAGFKSVFDLEYTESPWSRAEERRLETVFGVFQFVVAGDIGTIRCNETTWEVVNVVTFGN